MWSWSGARVSWAPLTLTVGMLALAPSAKAIDVFLDWSGFETELAHAWDDAGWTGAGEGLTASDYLAFKHNVTTRMAGVFSGYTLGLFDSAPAGVHETIKFGSTTALSLIHI